jgi:RNA-directed DNA polymerase
VSDRLAGCLGACGVHVRRSELRDVELVVGARGSCDRTFRPLPVRDRMIPKAGGKLRRLGTPTERDRVVQAALSWCSSPSSKLLQAMFVWVPS